MITNLVQKSMDTRQIQAIVLCIFRRKESILVLENYDNEHEEYVYQLPGGSVGFGEYSWESVRRQIRSELGEEIENLTFLGPEENVTAENGKTLHEIIFMFKGDFVNKENYRKSEIGGDNPGTSRAVWKPVSEFQRKKLRLHPEGLTDLLSMAE